ncbi:MAG: hypothetical protein F4Y74_08035 [Gemmatimonadales bacterium]|nr:hypothetical protein [Gemmatimonadales bacterium]MYG19675.1 hypothetical protein [Gemmatimonadales bacterium]MYH10463.1 hypothetical protein [Gemmatimonadales bacterium]
MGGEVRGRRRGHARGRCLPRGHAGGPIPLAAPRRAPRLSRLGHRDGTLRHDTRLPRRPARRPRPLHPSPVTCATARSRCGRGLVSARG